MIQCERKGIILVEHPVCRHLVAFGFCHPVADIVSETEGRQVGGKNNAAFPPEIVERNGAERVHMAASTDVAVATIVKGRKW
jgi:hypothetical protein